jgi:hypothetical protein
LFPWLAWRYLREWEFAFAHFERMAEFSCDRAGLLVVQDPEIAGRSEAKMAGVTESLIRDLNFEAILEQLEEYERYNQNVVGLYNKVGLLLGGRGLRDHPMSVLRLKRILDWENRISTKTFSRATIQEARRRQHLTHSVCPVSPVHTVARARRPEQSFARSAATGCEMI